jgi:two-component sensor histidine kinase
MGLLDTPDHSYKDFYDVARFRLAWRINILLTFTLFAISIFYVFHNTTTAIQYFSGFIIAFIGVVYLIATKKFILVSYFMVVCTLALVVSSLYFVKNIPHFIEPLWLLIVAIFSYFNLGKRVGHVVLTIVGLTISIYFYFFLNDNETLKIPLSFTNLIGTIIELCLCIFIVGYFLFNFIETTADAEQKFREANIALNEQNKMIKLQNEEKTVLLKEIHHRVKNNLQVITSLLRLQSADLESEETKSHFSDAINRVMTMSLIHQKMYQSKNLSQLDVSDYFSTLINDLILSSSIKIPVEISVNSNLEKVGSKTIVPLALLIAELVSNSLKHAFEEKGKISIELSAEENGTFDLIYKDNGVWKEKSNPSSFGLQLIDTLIEQLEGKMTLSITENGTEYLITLCNLDV